MIYDKYKARISKIAKFLWVVRRYRILIMSVILTVMAITTVLLSTNGMVYGDGKCPSTIAYGQTLEYDAHAFLAKVDLEFYNSSTKTWTSEQPRLPGRYKVRAVSENIFGDKKYGEVHEFTIVPKSIPVKVSVNTIEYGQLPPVTADLVDEGSRITCTAFDYYGLGEETVQVIPRSDAIKITDSKGADITSCYEPKGEVTLLTFTARTVVVAITDIEHVYDGQVFTSDAYTVEEGSFLPTDTVVGVFTGSVETVGEESINNATFTVYRGEADVTSYYNIICAPGILTVAKRPLLLQTKSATHTYDGTEFSAPEYTIAEDTPIAKDHRVVVDDYARLTEIGSVANTLTVRILDANDVDVTDNYEISFPEDSVLTVVKRVVSITSEDAEKYYDGTPLTHHVCNVDDGYSIADGQYYVATWTGTLTEQGDVENAFTVKVYIDDGDGDDTTHGPEVTSNYDITCNYGRLVVGYTQITFKTASAEKQYDNIALKAESCVEILINGAATAVVPVDGKETHLEIHDQFVLVLTDFAEIVEVGETDNVATYKIVSKDDLDGEHNRNYQVTPEWGTLRVTQREISVWAVDVDKVYDGTPLESDEVQWDIQLPDGHILTADLIGSQTYFGTSANTLLEENISITYNGQDVKQFFTFVGLKDGEISITTRYLYLTTHTHTWTYDGAAHKDSGAECDLGGYGDADLKEGVIDGVTYFLLPNAHTLVLDETSAPEITNYNESGKLNELSFFVYANVNGTDIDVTSDNFTIVFNEIDSERGKLYIDRRELVVLSKSDSKTYDGTALTAEDYQIIGGSLVAGQTLVDCNYHAGIVDVGTEENVWNFRIEDAGQIDVTDNYAIDKQNGTLEITPRYIWINTHTHSWMYDGNWHSDMTVDCVLGGYNDGDLTIGQHLSVDGSQLIDYMKLADDQFLFVATATSVRDVNEGAVENVLTFNVLDINSQDVTKNYVFRYTNAAIWINRRPIEIQANDVTWVYDDKAHYDGDGTSNCKAYTNADNVTASQQDVVSGETIALDTTSFATTSKITDVGDIVNNPQFVVWRNGKREISDNYTITVLPGTLTVTQRYIWINTHSVTWEYDGIVHYEGDTYHTAETYDNGDLTVGTIGGVTYASLVNGHTLRIDTAMPQAMARDVADSGTANVLQVLVYSNGSSVTDNYNISYAYGTLTITPRAVTITAKSDETVYNGLYQTMPKNAVEDDIHTQLAPNQTLYYVETLGVVQKNVGKYTHEIVGGSAVIHDAAGTDVTVNYAITYRNGTYTIKKRKINILTHDHTWQYDADPHYDNCSYGENDLTLPNATYFATLDELTVGSHSLKTSTYTAITNVWESWTSGDGNNVMTFDVLDATGVVVTDNYEITYTYGKLIITPLDIEIVAHSKKEMYDGLEHSIPAGSYDIIGLLSNTKHTHVVGYLYVSGANRTDVGTTPNRVYISTLEIIDENGNDVTGNYKVVKVEDGTLEVTVRPIYVKQTHTCTWEYDGIAHQDGDGLGDTCAYGNADLINDQVKCFGLVLDHELKPIAGKNTASIQNVLESGKVNTVEFGVYYADGTVNANYEIHIDANCAYGTLNVTPRDATIVSASATKVYDGTPLTKDDIESDFGVLKSLGHYVVANATGSQTNAYTATDKTKGECENVFNPQIFDVNGVEVTSNYAITKVNGILTVTKRPIVVISDDAEKVYDGNPLTKHSYTTHYEGDEQKKGLVLDHIIQPTYTGTLTFVGETPNAFTATTANIADGAGNYDVGQNYTISSLVEGTLKVTPRKITVAPSSDKKVYDGTPLIAHNQYDLLDKTTLAKGDTLTISTVRTEIINVGKKDHEFTNPNNPNASIVWKDGVTSVTFCYEITYSDKPGVLEITPCEVTLRTAGAMKVYDGQPLVNPVYEVIGLPTGHTYGNMYTIGSQTYPGWSENILNSGWYILNAGGVDITNSGNLTYYYEYGLLEVQAEEIIGALSIKPVDLIIGKTETPPATYMGSVEDANNGVGLWILERSGGCSYTAKIASVYNGTEWQTEIQEFHLYDVGGKEITYIYDITYEPGKVAYQEDINIRITLPFKEKIYDGTPLTYTAKDESYVLIDKPSDVEVRVNLAGLSRTEVGTIGKEELMSYVEVTRNGVSIINACTIDFGAYNLVVRPIGITVETQSAIKIYDGEPLSAPNVQQPIGLLPGHRLMGKDEWGNWIELKAPSSITGIGNIKNFLDLDECKIMNEATGEDVTHNYLITIKQGELRVIG